ncbi:unnamed protein product [Lactuca saligna]|uniref:Uncharacterized protein n=1 Tax=Lactuca saligna TaxID=75948 RepID=A0AA36E3Y0_LACSI|nr:unnamed protein product [Lactuca saligna]
MKMVVIAPTSSQPGMSKTRRSEVDLQEEIIPDANEKTNYQSILDTVILNLRGRFLKEVIGKMIWIMINSILKRGRLPSQWEIMMLKMDVLQLMILQDILLRNKRKASLSLI